jgi:hypothetical protein
MTVHVNVTRNAAKKSREWDAPISDSRKPGNLSEPTQFVSRSRPATKVLAMELARALQKGLARGEENFRDASHKKTKP